VAYRNEIQRLDISIQQGKELFKQKTLTDEQAKQLANDVGYRHMVILFLKKHEDGECIIIVTNLSSFNPF
jgi:hypothetical protein